MHVPCGGVEAAMAQQDLDGSQVCASLQQVSGEAMSQRVDRDMLVQLGMLGCPSAGLEHGAGRDGLLGCGAGEEIAAQPNCFAAVVAEDSSNCGESMT